MSGVVSERHDWVDASETIAEAQYLEVPEELSVYSWSPEPPGTRDVKATQVHLHFGAPPGLVFVVRFKGPDTLDALLRALHEHRNAVWGQP